VDKAFKDDVLARQLDLAIRIAWEGGYLLNDRFECFGKVIFICKSLSYVKVVIVCMSLILGIRSEFIEKARGS
jgi:hypothetical protein